MFKLTASSAQRRLEKLMDQGKLERRGAKNMPYYRVKR
jgi:hypothetical protein